MRHTANLFPDQDLDDLGTWEQPAADLVTWTHGNVLWTSTARYDEETDLYSGRTPVLCVDGKPLSFEAAVEFGERLGQSTVWLP